MINFHFLFIKRISFIFEKFTFSVFFLLDRETEGKIEKRKDRQKGSLTVRRIDILTEKQIDRTIDRRTVRRTERSSDRQKDRHVNRELKEITEGESLPPYI